MKKNTYRYWLLAAVCQPLFSLTLHAQIVVEHMGANDPVTEGFALTRFLGNPEVGPVFDDLGRDAWMIKLTSVSDNVQYTHNLTQQQGEDAMRFGWELSATVRFLSMPPSTGLAFHTGNDLFWMMFRTFPNGVLYVTDNRGTAYSFEDHDGGYHNYKLVYDPLSELAKLWVDGIDTGVEFLPRSSTSGSWLMLGAGESVEGTQAHWHEINLTIVPEPATLALLTGVGALFVAGIVRRRKRKGRSRSGELW